jgi:hypothetical protein
MYHDERATEKRKENDGNDSISFHLFGTKRILLWTKRTNPKAIQVERTVFVFDMMATTATILW